MTGTMTKLPFLFLDIDGVLQAPCMCNGGERIREVLALATLDEAVRDAGRRTGTDQIAPALDDVDCHEFEADVAPSRGASIENELSRLRPPVSAQ